MKYKILILDPANNDFAWIRPGINFGRRKKYSSGAEPFAIEFESFEEAKAAVEYYKENYHAENLNFYICVFQD